MAKGWRRLLLDRWVEALEEWAGEQHRILARGKRAGAYGLMRSDGVRDRINTKRLATLLRESPELVEKCHGELPDGLQLNRALYKDALPKPALVECVSEYTGRYPSSLAMTDDERDWLLLYREARETMRPVDLANLLKHTREIVTGLRRGR